MGCSTQPQYDRREQTIVKLNEPKDNVDMNEQAFSAVVQRLQRVAKIKFLATVLMVAAGLASLQATFIELTVALPIYPLYFFLPGLGLSLLCWRLQRHEG